MSTLNFQYFVVPFLFEVVTGGGYLPSEHPELWYASMWFVQYWHCDNCTSRDQLLWVTDVVTN